MQALTVEHLDTLVTQAITDDDTDSIARYGNLLDSLEADQRQQRGIVTLAAAALWYASQGLHVFPLQPGLKIPYKGSRGCHDGTDDATRIRAWWSAKPESNIGLATGHLVDVVDIDGTTGQISRARNLALFDSLTVIGIVNTPRPGGVHLYVPTVGFGNSAGKLPGIDYRGVGGYVVVPPSVNTDGVTYSWTRPLGLASVAVAA